MQHLYIENYVDLPYNQKEKFLKLVNKCKDFKVSSSQVVFSEQSLILNFINDYDTQNAYKTIKGFSDKFKNIKVKFVEKLFSKDKQTILFFNESEKQIRI